MEKTVVIGDNPLLKYYKNKLEIKSRLLNFCDLIEVVLYLVFNNFIQSIVYQYCEGNVEKRLLVIVVK